MGYYTQYSLEVVLDDDIDLKTREDVLREELLKCRNDEDRVKLFNSFNYTPPPTDFGIIESLRKENENAEYALEDDGSFSNECKWYYCEADLTKFSKKYPQAVFILSGEGEESGDIWKAKFKNGICKKVVAKIVFDDL